MTDRHLLLAIGIAILIVAAVDIFGSTMARGGGILNRRLTSALWGLLSRGGLMDKWRKSRELAAIIVTLAAVVWWLILVWAGWSLIFSGSEHAVLESKHERPATFAERVYFAGFTISTLGIGDYKPNGALWQVATILASCSGFCVVTFIISYLMPIVQAATHRRTVAARILAIGGTPDEWVISGCRGGNCERFVARLDELTSELALIEQRHHAYPVLHYMHAASHYDALSIAVTVLDESITLVEKGLHDRAGVAEADLVPARRVVTRFLATLQSAYAARAEQAPPPPPLKELRRAGLPVVETQEFEAALEQMQSRRAALAGLLHAEGFVWSDLYSDQESDKGARGRRRSSLAT